MNKCRGNGLGQEWEGELPGVPLCFNKLGWDWCWWGNSYNGKLKLSAGKFCDGNTPTWGWANFHVNTWRKKKIHVSYSELLLLFMFMYFMVPFKCFMFQTYESTLINSYIISVLPCERGLPAVEHFFFSFLDSVLFILFK